MYVQISISNVSPERTDTLISGTLSASRASSCLVVCARRAVHVPYRLMRLGKRVQPMQHLCIYNFWRIDALTALPHLTHRFTRFVSDSRQPRQTSQPGAQRDKSTAMDDDDV